MKANHVHMAVIIDKSGSMAYLADTVITSFNEYVSKQKKEEGTATLSLVEFNSEAETIFDFVDLQLVKELTKEDYKPRGGTALNDSLAKFIISTGKKLADMNEDERPSGVQVLVITDGHENASKEYTDQQVKDMVEHQEEKYDWDFTYIGANVDVQRESTVRGFKKSLAFESTERGTMDMFMSLHDTGVLYRKSKAK